MKKVLLFLFTILSTQWASAQWTTLTSGTTAALKDVDFSSDSIGVVVGNSGTILRTTDAGTTWTDINNNALHGDFHSVSVKNADTIFVSSYDFNTAGGDVYVTMNGGANWIPVKSESGINHRVDLDDATTADVFAAGSSVYSSTDFGTTWNSLFPFIAGTNKLDILKFADNNVGHVSGIVSGIVTYSASFIRSEDGGATWFANDPFSWPNANALTTMCFRNADTVFVFTNQYNGFSPGTINGVEKLTNFQKISNFPGDTSFSFTSQVLNTTMPAYMNDAVFRTFTTGYAFGENGGVYKTVSGGATWTLDYSAGSPLKSTSFSSNLGYAVGDNGTIIKFSPALTAIPEKSSNVNVSVFPNPASDVMIVNLNNLKEMRYTIMNTEGKKVKTGQLNSTNNSIQLAELQNGFYVIHFNYGNTSFSKEIVVNH